MVRGSFQILPHPTDSPQQYYYYQIKLVGTDKCGRQDWDTISVVLPSTYGPAGLNGLSICGRLVDEPLWSLGSCVIDFIPSFSLSLLVSIAQARIRQRTANSFSR